MATTATATPVSPTNRVVAVNDSPEATDTVKRTMVKYWVPLKKLLKQLLQLPGQVKRLDGCWLAWYWWVAIAALGAAGWAGLAGIVVTAKPKWY